MRVPTLLLVVAAVTGCTAIQKSTSMFPNRNHDWRLVATSDDQKRLHDWRSDFVAALTAARKAGHGAEIDREGALLQPDAAIADQPLAVGLYSCRMLRVGAKTEYDRAFTASPPMTCRVSQSGTLQRLVTAGGQQREMGLIFPGDALRQVFLGTLMLPAESRAMQYGADEDRDVAGMVERIGPDRWRVVMPTPHFQSLLDVLELVPMAGATR